MNSYKSFVSAHFLKTLSSVGSLAFVSLLLLNPSMYSGLISQSLEVNAMFLYNGYQSDLYPLSYPLNEEGEIDLASINDATPLLQWHIVQRGESIEQIAQKYAISVEQIKMVNNLLDNDLLAGQMLYITNMKGFIYEVKEEKISLMVFANMYDLDVDELMQANGQVNDQVPYERGQAIFVPDMTLEQAYANSLLIKPQPKPQPEKIVVPAIKKPAGSVSNSVKPKPKPSQSIVDTLIESNKGNSIVSSRRYVFKEQNTMAAGQCTYYAAHKASWAFPELSSGVRFRSFGGNANKWLGNAKAAGFKTSSTPSVGAIAVFKQGGRYYPGAGHVSIVEEVDHSNKRMKVSDMNYAGLWVVTVRWISLNDAMTQTKGGQTLMGFIPSQKLPDHLQAKYEASKR